MLRCCYRAHTHCALQLDVVQVVLVVASAQLFADIVPTMLLHLHRCCAATELMSRLGAATAANRFVRHLTGMERQFVVTQAQFVVTQASCKQSM